MRRAGAFLVFFAATLGILIRTHYYLNATARSVASGGLSFGDETAGTSLVLMGDSHASVYGTLCRDVAEELGCKLNIISVAAGNPLRDDKAAN